MDGLERFHVPGEALGCVVEVEMREGLVTRVRLTRSPAPATQALGEAALALRTRIALHLENGAHDLRDVPVDLRGLGAFHRLALERLRDVPPGQVVTYGELAAQLGQPGASRAVGGAMRANPVPFIVPCHRVVQSQGGLGHYSGEGGAATKRRLLALERAPGYHVATLASFGVSRT